MVRFHRCAVLLVVVGWGVTVPARTDADQAPAPPSLPARLGLDQALDIVRTRGFDVLVADAQVRGAEGDLRAAQAVPNPALSFGYGRVLGYEAQLAGQDPNQYAAGLSDQAALFDSLWGKRSLRTDVARRALAASRMARQDALRTLEWQVKQQYAQVAQASAELRFAEQVVETTSGILALNRQRYPQVIDEGALARIETQKYEADQARDQAVLALRSGRVGLAFLLGARDAVPDFEVDASALDYRIPVALGNASEATLMRLALERRPDLLESRWEQARAQSASALARRQRLPDVTISAQYTQTGTGQNAIQPPTLGFSVSAPIPIFYQQQGEIERADADLDARALSAAKVTAQVVADVAAAFAGFVGSRRLVERMQAGLLSSAKRARDVTEVQFKSGAATLMDFLDAERTFVATNVEYLQDLTAYWTAVYQLEQAVGTDLR